MRLLRTLEDLLWPRAFQCLCCETVSEGDWLCPECARQLEKQRLPDAGGSIRSVWSYAGVAGTLVRGLKDRCIADCARVLAEGMAEVIREMELPPETVLTWVTMPPKRANVRGMDHGMLLCREVAVRTGLPMRRMLDRLDGRTQRGMNREQRLRNLHGKFSCGERMSGPVLLIDDVLTTGATVSVCAQTLMAGGAEAVYVVTATKTEIDVTRG